MDNALGIFLINVLWQSSFLLLVSLVLCQFLKKRPARAHAVLLCCLLAAIVAPAATTVVGNAGWGFLATKSLETQTNTSEFDLRTSSFENSESLSVDNHPEAPTKDLSSQDESIPSNISELGSSSLNENSISRLTGFSFSSLNFKAAISPVALVVIWCLLSISLLMWTLVKICREWRIIRSSTPVSDERTERIMMSVVESMKISRVPVIRSATSSFGPTIWCWGRRPIILLSEDIRQRLNGKDLRSVITHELAHLKRRDHLSMAVGMVATTLLPWHPFVWLASRRLRALCERVCDEWVLHYGTQADQYAESLLNLIATRRPSFALAVGASRKRLESRIRCILNQKRNYESRVSR